MNAQEYMELALRTAPNAEQSVTQDQLHLLLGGLGAADEAGEIAGLIKKHVFHGHLLDWEKLAKEIGDVLWYLNYLVSRMPRHAAGRILDLSDVMLLNIQKLSSRYPEGFFSSERSINRAAGDE